VTPASGYIGAFPAMVIGFFAGLVCYFAIVWKGRFGYDDSLDVVGIHGVGGILGILATGLFASKAINAGGADGLFYGNSGQFGVQVLTAVVTAVFSAVGSYVILKIVDGVTGLRIQPDEEATGLDLSQHNERAYS
jgi:ammonium transporter, Amt family